VSDVPDDRSVDHPVVFAHIAVPDLDAAATFYRAALHWTAITVLAPDGSPVMIRCSTGAKPNVGLVPGVPSPGGCSIYVLCEHLEATARQWVAAGGTVRAPEPFAELGQRLAAADPWGNEIMLWSWEAGKGWRPASP
jgi:predicted enzyme related to lactoylglutathione lyase